MNKATISSSRYRVALGNVNTLQAQASRLGTLPQQLLRDAERLPEIRKRQFLAGRLLLVQLIAPWAGADALLQIDRGSNGKPAFHSPELPFFNISHNGDRVMVFAASLGDVGCDIERQRPQPRALDIARRLFSIQEQRWLEQLPQEHRDAGFWKLWTVREALVKQNGTGVWHMRSTPVNPETLQIQENDMPQKYLWHDRYHDYLFSLCGFHPFSTPHKEQQGDIHLLYL